MSPHPSEGVPWRAVVKTAALRTCLSTSAHVPPCARDVLQLHSQTKNFNYVLMFKEHRLVKSQPREAYSHQHQAQPSFSLPEIIAQAGGRKNEGGIPQ